MYISKLCANLRHLVSFTEVNIVRVATAVVAAHDVLPTAPATSAVAIAPRHGTADEQAEEKSKGDLHVWRHNDAWLSLVGS